MAVAVAAVSCSKSAPNEITTNHTCTFDFSNAASACGTDGYYFKQAIVSNDVFAFCNKTDDTQTQFLGGFALVGLADDVLEEDHVANPLCVYGTGYKNSRFYATFKYSSQMPEYDGYFRYAGLGYLKLGECYVNNTNQVVTIAKLGLPGIPPFAEGDYLKVKMVANANLSTTDTKSIEFTLAEFKDGNLNVIDEWTRVDLEPLETVEGLKILVQSNRNDVPLMFCMENVTIASKVSY